jgi:hypothetical protein
MLQLTILLVNWATKLLRPTVKRLPMQPVKHTTQPLCLRLKHVNIQSPLNIKLTGKSAVKLNWIISRYVNYALKPHDTSLRHDKLGAVTAHI